MKLLLLLPLLVLLHSCGEVDPESLFSCPDKETFYGNTSSVTVGATQKISQRMHMNGIVGTKIYSNKVTFQMESSNLSAIKLEVYKGDNGSNDNGSLLGSTTVTSGLGSSDIETKIEFILSSEIYFEVGTSYYFVLTPTGGSFTIPYVSPTKIAVSDINIYNGTSWTSSGFNSSNLSFEVDYNSCNK